MNNLAQFYTQDSISRLLLSKILIRNPKKILELGVGGGSLFRAAKDKWKNSDIIGADIDGNNINTLKKEFPETKLYVINGLSSNLYSELKVELGSIDVAICNPPYIPIKKNDILGKIIEESSLGIISEYNNITSDLVFLAQNLLMLKNGGELGIIIPDGLLTCHNFKYFRENLINNYKVKGIIELPAKVFLKTEAKTHILIIKKNISSYKNVPIYLSDHEGQIISKIIVNKKNLYRRMDYKYHSWKSSNKKSGKTLAELGVEIFRGSLSKKDLLTKEQEFIHTSDLKSVYASENFQNNERLSNFRYAEEGDILISRVGKRCLGKIMYIESGGILISDCVYRLRVPELYRKEIIDSLKSDYGREWIKAHSHGVCAKVISKVDLLGFKILSKK